MAEGHDVQVLIDDRQWQHSRNMKAALREKKNLCTRIKLCIEPELTIDKAKFGSQIHITMAQKETFVCTWNFPFFLSIRTESRSCVHTKLLTEQIIGNPGRITARLEIYVHDSLLPEHAYSAV